MRFSFFFLFAIVAACMGVGSSTRCYTCSALLSTTCISGVHTSDPLFQIRECDGKCMKVDIPKEKTANQPTTSKMCLPYIGIKNPGEPPLTIDSCNNMDYCYICDGELCNSADKITGVAVSLVALCTLLFLL